jgi:hypothetical protein
MVGRPGSPRIAKAAQLLIENVKFTAKVALLMAGYDPSVASSSKAQKTVSKKKQRIIDAVRRSEQREKMRNYRKRATIPTDVTTANNASDSSNNTGISSLTTSTNEGAVAALISLKTSSSNGTSIASKDKEMVAKKRSTTTKINGRSKQIAANSRRTAQQLNKFHIEKKK